MSAYATDGMTDEQLADYYLTTGDLSEFAGDAVPVTRRRERLDVSITVRFTPDEIDALRARADEQGMRVTALIRQLAVEHTGDAQIVHLATARRLAQALAREVGALNEQLGNRDPTAKPRPATSTPAKSTKATKATRTTKTTKATTTKKFVPKKSAAAKTAGKAASIPAAARHRPR